MSQSTDRDKPAAPAHAAEKSAHWRALAADASPADIQVTGDEFPAPTEALALDPVQRRDFIGLIGASVTLAGLGMSSCVRKPKENILPYAQRPEDRVPGKPRYFATSAKLAGGVVGLLVESQDGRPTKVEGNPSHPMSHGATDVFAQASVLDLYSPSRLDKPRIDGRQVSAAALQQRLARLAAELEARAGAGLAILLRDERSPTLHRLIRDISTRLPQARLFVDDVTYPHNAIAGAALVGREGVRPRYKLERAERVLTLDADILGLEGDVVHNAHAFAEQRRLRKPQDNPARLYAVEPTFTVTGISADNRLRLAPSQIGSFAAALAATVLEGAREFPAALTPLIPQLRKHGQSANTQWVAAVGRDLLDHIDSAVVVVGQRQPPLVHAIGHAINAALGATDNSFDVLLDILTFKHETIEALSLALASNQVGTLVVLGGNPVYEAPADLRLSDVIGNAATRIHLAADDNETTKLCNWAVPCSHYLESWGDHLASDGTWSTQQPLIAPLHPSLSPIELLARLSAAKHTSGYLQVRETFRASGVATSDVAWRRALHNGIAAAPSSPAGTEPTAPEQPLTASINAYRWSALAEALSGWRSPPTPTPDALELVFQLDTSVHDGRFASNPWLQELPDPVTKLTWDNALLVGPSTARRLGLRSESLYRVKTAGRSLVVAAWITPGVADHCVVLHLGYGRRQSGAVADGRGFDANRLRVADAPWFVQGVKLEEQRGQYQLVSTQEHGSLKEPDLGGREGKTRPLLMEGTLEHFRRDPRFAKRGQLMRDDQLKSLWTLPNETQGPQWGMSIDLGTCIGCNACTIACQAENNIPVVGKEQVANNREMHWIRIDRYFAGNPDDPYILDQPMACAHCETAPCESVCPVAATVHSPDGLNDMAYNRCIGTRYCSNNCPYKVRRFNFFNYQKDNAAAAPLRRMQMNPDVTVRFRGVMEKCTYCVQRINAARIAAKVSQTDRIADGAIVPACEQVCPTGAIVFGDISDPESRVSRLKRQDRDYAVLADLNLHPRTTYLAKIRNPNPELS